MTDATTFSSAYKILLDVTGKVEPWAYQAIRGELTDRRASLKLIASENYTNLPVLVTMGTRLSDKYTEGAIGYRFYVGYQGVDIVGSVATEHARELFGVEYACAQPHSGIDANPTTYWAILAYHIETPALMESGSRNVPELSKADWEALRTRFGSQRLLGVSLDAGGYPTHGFQLNVLGRTFHQRSYGANPTTGLLDYDALAAQAVEFKPLVVVAGYSACPRRIDFARMWKITDSVGAVLIVDMAHFAGLVAGEVFTGNENSAPLVQAVTTTTHKPLCDPRGGLVLVTKDYAGNVDRGCPMILGGPPSYIIVVEAVALAGARIGASRDYIHRVVDSAHALVEGLLKRGNTLVTGDTDNHIVLLGVSSFGLIRWRVESAPLDSGIVINRNSVPNDSNGAWYTSGIRPGTSALTPRGFATSDMDEIAAMITDVLKKAAPTTTKDSKLGKTKYGPAQEVADGSKDCAAKLLDLHPFYPDLAL